MISSDDEVNPITLYPFSDADFAVTCHCLFALFEILFKTYETKINNYFSERISFV